MMLSYRTADLLMTHKEHEDTKQKQEAERKREMLLDHPLEELADNPNIDILIKEALASTMQTLHEGYEFYDSPDVRKLTSESSDGFYKHYKGGWSVVGVTSVDHFSSSGTRPDNKTLSNAIDRLESQSYTEARDKFISDYGKQLKERGIPDDKINYSDLYELQQGSLAEKLSEAENEELSSYPLVFYIKVFYYGPTNRNKKFPSVKKPEIYIQAGVRESIDFDALQKQFSFGSLTELRKNLDACMSVVLKRLS